MFGSVNQETPLNGDVRLALSIPCAHHQVGTEGNFGVAIALKNLLVHAVVARVVARTSGARVHNDCAGEFAGGGIKTDMALLDVEFPMDLVRCGGQSEAHGGLWSIQRGGKGARSLGVTRL